MPPKIEKYQMRLRMESKAEENRAKPPLQSPDVAETAEFLFSRSLPHRGGQRPPPVGETEAKPGRAVPGKARLYRLCLQ